MSPGGGYQMKRGLGFFLSLCRLPDTGGIYLFTKGKGFSSAVSHLS